MRCKDSVPKGFASTMMINFLLDVSIGALNYYYWKVTWMMNLKETITKPIQIFPLIHKFHCMLYTGWTATYNFISDKVAALLRLPVLPTKPLNVWTANGQALKCQGRFDNIHICVQGIPFSITFYSFPLTSLDMVLGVQWLEQQGLVVCDWKKITMECQ